MKKYIVTVLGLMIAPAIALACPVNKPPQATPTPAPSQPVLQLTKVAPPTVSVGGTATYGIAVTNISNVTATNIKITDFPPKGFTYVSGSPECVATGQTDGSVVCTIASLPGGMTVKQLTLVFLVNSAVDCPTPVNRALMTSPMSIASIVGSQCVTTTPTPSPTPVPENPGIDITKKVSNSVSRPGHEVDYVIEVKNTGKVKLMDVQVSDSLANAYTNVKLDGKSLGSNTFLVTDQTLEPGQTLTYKIQGTVKSNVSCGSTIKNTAVVKSDDHGVEDEASATTEVQCVKAAVVAPKPITPVAVTARTGAGSLAAVVTLLGAAGLGVTRRLFA